MDDSGACLEQSDLVERRRGLAAEREGEEILEELNFVFDVVKLRCDVGVCRPASPLSFDGLDPTAVHSPAAIVGPWKLHLDVVDVVVLKRTHPKRCGQVARVHTGPMASGRSDLGSRCRDG